MYKKISILLFTPEYLPEIKQFIAEINNYLFYYNTLTLAEISSNFSIIISNFQRIISLLNINENWRAIHNSRAHHKQQHLNLTNTTQEYIANNLPNIIYEFHKYSFTPAMIQIYKLIINAILIYNKDRAYTKPLLSCYLTNSIIYNNITAIQLLLEEYHVSPVAIWPNLPNKYSHLQTIIMPILQPIDSQLQHNIVKFFYTDTNNQEQTFIYLLTKINFHLPSLTTSQLQEIFRLAFKNGFIQATKYLLTQQEVRTKLQLTEEDFIMLAISKIFINQYNELVDVIAQDINIQPQLDNYINILNNILTFNTNSKNLDHIILKIALEVTRAYIANNDNVIRELLLKYQQQIAGLKAQNSLLYQNTCLLNQQLFCAGNYSQRANISTHNTGKIKKSNSFYL